MSSQPLVYDLENQDGTYELQPKSLYAGDSYQGQPSVAVTEDEIILAGDSNNVIRVDPDFGVLLSGNLSLSAMPQQVSFGGGYYRLNPTASDVPPLHHPHSHSHAGQGHAQSPDRQRHAGFLHVLPDQQFGCCLMAVDFRWMSRGGVLLDSTGDVSFTQSPWECLRSMANSRLKAAFDGWKSYQIGADLENVIGSTVAAELETTIQRQVESSMSQDFLPMGSFTVSTLKVGNQAYQVFVFIQNQLVASTTVSTPAST